MRWSTTAARRAQPGGPVVITCGFLPSSACEGGSLENGGEAPATDEARYRRLCANSTSVAGGLGDAGRCACPYPTLSGCGSRRGLALGAGGHTERPFSWAAPPFSLASASYTATLSTPHRCQPTHARIARPISCMSAPVWPHRKPQVKVGRTFRMGARTSRVPL